MSAARQYLGARYRHRGRDRSGMDCAGLLLAVANDLGLPAPSGPIAYSQLPDVDLLDRMLRTYAIRCRSLEPGAVVRMSILNRAQHVGILGDYPGGDLSLIHVNGAIGKVCEHRLDNKWRRRIVDAWVI